MNEIVDSEGTISQLQNIDSLNAYLTALEQGGEAGLALLSEWNDPFAVRRRLAILLDEKRYSEAVNHVRGIPLHPEWADKAALGFAAAGDVPEVQKILDWARASGGADTLSWRCILRAAQGFYLCALRNHTNPTFISPGLVTTEEATWLRKAVDLLRPVTTASKALGTLRSELEASSLELEAVALAWLGEHDELQQVIPILDKHQPFVLLLARLAEQRLIPCYDSWPARLRDDFRDDFDAQILAALIEGELLGRREAAFQEALALNSNLTQEQAVKLHETLVELAQGIGPESIARVEELAPLLLQGQERYRKLAKARLLISQGQADKAAPLLTETRADDDTNWLQLHAFLLVHQGKGAEALTDLARAVDLFPHPDILRTMAVIAIQENQPTTATRALEMLLKHTHSDTQAREKLAQIYVTQHDFSRAAEHFAVLWEQDSADFRNGINLAASLAQSGDLKKGVEVYTEICSQEDAPVEAFVQLAISLKALGEPKAAYAQLIAVKERFWDEPDFLRMLLDLGFSAQEEAVGHEAMMHLRQLQAEGKAPKDVLQEKSLDQAVEFIVGRRRWMDQALENLTNGRLPWLTVDHLLGAPSYAAWYDRTQTLSWLADDPTVRARFCIYVTNGFAPSSLPNGAVNLELLHCPPKGTAVVADVSALLTLHQLDLISEAADYFGKIFIPSTYQMHAVEESGQLVLHQLSQKTELESIQASLDTGKIRVVEQTGAEVALVSEYSDDHSRHVYHLRDILDGLHGEGRITDEQVRQARLTMHLPPSADSEHPPLQTGQRVGIELSALRTLAGQNLLIPALRTFLLEITVAERNEVAANLRAIAHQEDVRLQHRNLWEAIRRDTHFVQMPYSRPSLRSKSKRRNNEERDHRREVGIAGPILAQQVGVPLLADDRVCQGFVLYNTQAPATYYPFGTDQLLVSLNASNVLDEERVADCFLQLFRWRYRFIVPPASVLKTLAYRYASKPPGQELRDISLYVQDCMRDEGIAITPATSDHPEINPANRLFQEWLSTVAVFIIDVWGDNRFTEDQAGGITVWALRELLPSPPRILGLNSTFLPARTNRFVLSHALLRSAIYRDTERINHGLRAICFALGIPEELYVKTIAEVIHAF